MLQGSLTLVWLMCEDFNKYSLEHRAAHVLVRFIIPQLSLVSHRLSTIADRLLIRSFAERLEFKMSATDAEPINDTGIFVLPYNHSIVMALYGEVLCYSIFIIADRVLLKPVGFY